MGTTYWQHVFEQRKSSLENTFLPPNIRKSGYIGVLKTARSKTRKIRKSRKTRKFFSEIFIYEFSILAVGQIENLEIRKLGIIFPRFLRFPKFPSFRFATFSFSFLIFFFFYRLNIFSGTLFYICNFSSTLYKYSSFIVTRYDFMCLCFDL